MQSVVQKVEEKYKKKAVVDIKSGDTVKVHQKIREGGKERIQIFEGLIIRVTRKNSHSQSFTVRRIASGIGVEKTYFIHSPNILKIEVIKRAKVRRNYLSYMRSLTGKNARLMGIDFDKDKVNIIHDQEAEAEEEKIKEEAEARHDEDVAERKAEEAADDAKAKEALAKHDEAMPDAEKIESLPKERAEAKAPAKPQNKEK
jgi:large subunit ribosomal protein L19